MNDLISKRDAIIAMFSDPPELHYPDWYMSIVEQVKTPWVPVTKQLPEELKPVNITYINEDPAPYYEHIKGIPFTATAIYYRGGWYWWSCTCADVLAEHGHCYQDSMHEGIEVKAWMPLPKPYEPQESEGV